MFTWRRITLCLTLVTLLLALCLVGSCQPAGDGPVATAPRLDTEADRALDELSQDIDLLFTVNRLDLQPAQVKPLLDLIAQVEQEKAKLEPQRQAALAQLIPLLREKRALLVQDKDVPEDLDAKVQAAQTKVEEAGQGIANANAKYVPDLKKVLTTAQVSIITGADEARSQADELLQWIRELPAAEYTDEAKANAEQLQAAEVNLPAAAIMKVFDEARKMSAADYAKNKDGLITKLAPLYMPMDEAADDALLQFFSAPRLGVILKERAG